MLKERKKYSSEAVTALNQSKELKFIRLGWLLIIGWTLILVIVVAWNWFQVKESTQKEALITLRMTVDKDLTFRAWATEHGGVYVPVTPETQPNPNLSHIENRDVITSTGEKFTLLNPAYIMRQVYEIGLDNFGVVNRLTSLKPINPINAADSWETESLIKFEKNNNIEEISAITELNDKLSIRLMKPFYIEEGCLKCHGHQGYQVGDLRGALSASTPLEPYTTLIRSRQLSLIPGYGLIWLVGLGGIKWFMYRMEASARKLKEKEARNRAMIKAIPDMLFRYSREGVYLDAEVKGDSLISQSIQKKIKNGAFIGQKINTILSVEIAENLMQAIEKVVSTGNMQLIEYTYTIQQKQFYFEERLVLEGKNEVISIVRDVTNQKNFEAKLEYLSFHDEMTGLYNRNYFDNELKRLSRSREYPISIISIDVNGLKLINDTLGHVAGDQLLIACARVLKQSLRNSDVLARVGGDEFVAILPQTNETYGIKIVNRIKNNVTNYCERFPSLPLSLSLGIATAEKNTEELIDIYKEADDLMYKEKLEKRTTVKDNIIKTLMSSLKDKCYICEDYERKLKEICHKIGKKMGLSSQLLTKLNLLSQVHNIGIVSISDEILSKKEKRTEEESTIIKQHPEKGYRIALSLPKFSEIADLILKHHEKWDGNGYPLGLKEKEIPLECRIFAVADAFVSMTSHLSYRNALSMEEAIVELKNGSGSNFDPGLVDVLISILESN